MFQKSNKNFNLYSTKYFYINLSFFTIQVFLIQVIYECKYLLIIAQKQYIVVFKFQTGTPKIFQYTNSTVYYYLLIVIRFKI